MKKIIILSAAVWLLHACTHKLTVTNNSSPTPVETTDKRGNPMLLGEWNKAGLEKMPYSAWFNQNYTNYQTDSLLVSTIKPALKKLHFEIFMGTWCGDSKREVPRMVRIMEEAGIAPSAYKIIMVDNHDSTIKQSPGHEEKGKDIFRVPTMIIYDHDKEIGRIIESPASSLEKDLQMIANREPYEPNYKGAYRLIKLIKEMGPAKIESDLTPVTDELKPLLLSANELNSYGTIMQKGNQFNRAVIAFRVNSILFPSDIYSCEKLAETYWLLNKKDSARFYCEEVLKKDPNNASAKKIMENLQDN